MEEAQAHSLWKALPDASDKEATKKFSEDLQARIANAVSNRMLGHQLRDEAQQQAAESQLSVLLRIKECAKPQIGDNGRKSGRLFSKSPGRSRS